MNQKVIIAKLEIAAFFILFLLYGFLCLHFYVERSTMTDYAFQLFKMIQTKNFNAEHLRYGSFTTQWLVVFFIKINASLKTILLAYSMNIYLQYLIIFGVIRFYFKDLLLAWCIVAYSMASVHFGFFYMGCELVFGGVWLCMLLAALNSIEKNETNRKINYFILILSILLLFTTHAFLLVIGGLVLAFLATHKFSKLKIFIIASLVMLFIIKIKFLTDGYESGKFKGIDDDIFLPRTVNQSYFTYFFKQQLNSIFIGVKFLWIIALVLLIIKRKWKFILSAISSLLGLYLVIYSFMPNGESLAYMDCYQSIWYLTCWIILSYMVFFYFYRFRHQYIAVLFLVSLMGLYKIYNEKLYTDRIDYYSEVMRTASEKGCNKLFVNIDQINMQKVLLTWATPYETLMLSTLNGKSQTIYINRDSSFNLEKYNQADKFLGATWLLDDSTTINHKYFTLESTKYCIWEDISINPETSKKMKNRIKK